jgi:hypothetical protein
MYERLKEQISVTNDKAEAAFVKFESHYSPEQYEYEKLSQTLIEKSLQIIPEIRRLANLEDGLVLAFDLLMFLGRQSYIDTGTVHKWQTTLHFRPKFEGLLDEMLE